MNDVFQPAAGAVPTRWLERPMAWLRPGGTQDGGEAYQLRFLAGSIALATAVSVLALALAARMGQWHGVAVTGSYLVLILAQGLAVRLGAPVRVMASTIIATVGLFLLVSALVPSRNQSGQLYWFLLIPLAARALTVPRHDAVLDAPSRRTELIAAAAGLAAVVVVISVASPVSMPVAGSAASARIALGLDVALFFLSALGLLHVHDLSVRENAAEVRRLRELLAICAWCHNIKHEGDWVTVERFMAVRQNVDLTHGMCPSCYERQTSSIARSGV